MRTGRGGRIALGVALGVGAVAILLVAYFAAFHGWLTAVPASDPATTQRVQAAHAATVNRLLIALGVLIIAEFVGVLVLVRRGAARHDNAARPH